MRQDEHTVSASVRDGIAIQKLKRSYRQESLNPPTIAFGALIGAFIAFAFWDVGYNASQTFDEQPLAKLGGQIAIALLGGFLGGGTGWIYREFKTLQYDWRYWSSRQRIIVGLFAVIIVILYIAFIVWSWLS